MNKNDMNKPNMPLNVRDNVWENIEKQLPKEKKTLFWYFIHNKVTSILVMSVLFAGLGYGFYELVYGDTNKTLTTISAKEKALYKPTVKTENKPIAIVKTPLKLKTFVVSTGTKIANNKLKKSFFNTSETAFDKTNVTVTSVLDEEKKDLIATQTVAKVLFKDSVITNTENKIAIISKPDSGMVSVHLVDNEMVKIINYTQNAILSKNEILDPKLKKAAFNKCKVYAGLGFGLYQTQLILSPSLMKLPAGNTKQEQLTIGLKNKTLYFGLQVGSQQTIQKSVMPGNYKNNYKALLVPSNKSMIPASYRNEFLDTLGLIIPGTKNNSFTQQFTFYTIGLQTNVNLVKYKKLIVDFGVSINYLRMQKAKAFFWDSVNSVGVAFTEKHILVLNTNQVALQINMGINYTLSPKWQVTLRPQVEYFVTPYLKHYYKAYIRNAGAQICLTRSIF